MKTLLAGLLSAGFALALRAGESGAPTENVASAEADADALRFMNGDSLRGTFMNVEADGTLRYRRTDAMDG